MRSSAAITAAASSITAGVDREIVRKGVLPHIPARRHEGVRALEDDQRLRAAAQVVELRVLLRQVRDQHPEPVVLLVDEKGMVCRLG
jgi:NADP-dependent 3-hydroxy acid dehydrogenase YdfG